MTELFEHDCRLFEITDGKEGHVWQSGEWRRIAPALAGEVWADGSKSPDPKDFGADMDAKRP